MEKTIVRCEIYESRFQNIIKFVYDDGTVEDGAGSYYPDEIHFDESEFVGLTRKQAMYLMDERDKAYLRS
jgi:hypothetical protein